jgi:LPXTG-site transpeptidase (sortase) family protein
VRQSLVGSALIGFGIVLLFGAAGIQGYATYAEWQHASHALPGPADVLPAQVAGAPGRFDASVPPTPTTVARPPTLALPPPIVAQDRPTRPPTPTVRPTATLVRKVLVPPTPTAVQMQAPRPAEPPAPEVALATTPLPATEPASPPPAEYGQPTWVTIPKIGVSTNVTEVGVLDGAYDVPLWDVGHHEDTPNPGAPGNAVLDGHLETIRAGHVFAHLKDLSAGDAVYTYTATQRLTWAVRETLTVPNTDRQFLGPSPGRRLTLYTCTGTFNPIARDYSHRLVVVAELSQAAPRTP